MNRKKSGVIFIIASMTFVTGEECKETTYIKNNCRDYDISEIDQEFSSIIFKDFSKKIKF